MKYFVEEELRDIPGSDNRLGFLHINKRSDSTWFVKTNLRTNCMQKVFTKLNDQLSPATSVLVFDWS